MAFTVRLEENLITIRCTRCLQVVATGTGDRSIENQSLPRMLSFDLEAEMSAIVDHCRRCGREWAPVGTGTVLP